VNYLEAFPHSHHPFEQNVGCGWYVLYWTLALVVFLIPVAYLFLIILQLALFNLIMLVVMVVWWFKFFRIWRAIIKRCIDNSRTKHYRKFIKGLKELECVV
jgi:ABC-type bacteriocin/lantibiotic exporter with double-glycine peptidase domain